MGMNSIMESSVDLNQDSEKCLSCELNCIKVLEVFFLVVSQFESNLMNTF